MYAGSTSMPGAIASRIELARNLQNQVIVMHNSEVRLIAQKSSQLDRDVTVAEVAARSREAFLALMGSGRTAWSNADLAAWMKGAYRAATCKTLMVEGSGAEGQPTPFSVARGTIDVSVDVLLLQAREEVLDVLRRIRSVEHRDTSFTFDALNHGFIVPCRDHEGVRGFLPADLRDMKLYERVLSLVAVDYIANPADYEDAMRICPLCEIPHFERAHSCPRMDSIRVRRAG